MLKRSRTVLFEDKVPGPGKTIANHWKEGEQDDGARKEEENQERNNPTSAQKVKLTASHV